MHWPYRTPDAFGRPFENGSIPARLTEKVRQWHWQRCGIKLMQDRFTFPVRFHKYPRPPGSMWSLVNEVKTLWQTNPIF